MEKRLTREQGIMSASIAHKTYVYGMRPSSLSEKQNNWLLIEEGEILIYTLEWLIRKNLRESGYKICSETLPFLTNQPGKVFLRAIWKELETGFSRNESSGDYLEGLISIREWLNSVTKNKGDYFGWWNKPSTLHDWFIRATWTDRDSTSADIQKKCPALFEPHDVNLDLALSEIASGIISNGEDDKDDPSIDLDSTHFHERVRFSPEMELRYHGSRNLLFIPLWLYQDQNPSNSSHAGYAAFMLGSFYDCQAIKEKSKELRTLITLLTQQDINTFSSKAIKDEEFLVRLGTLASPMAHHLKNPMEDIGAACHLLFKLVKNNKEAKQYLESIIQSKNEATRAIENLLDSVQVKDLIRSGENIEALVKEALSQIKIPSVITVQLQYEKDLPQVYVDKFKFIQILLNLIENALDAMMPEGGELRLGGSLEETPDQNFLKLSISDTGVGIKPEDRDKIFTPLFTTKDTGTGVGLTAAYHIVKAHGGKVYIQNSSTTEGTTFAVEIPINT